jgi:MinD superfamily P-loop ATPase
VKELLVCSGKGGTGKTSLVASFAALSDKTVVVDCDVDAADLHLLLQPRVERQQEFKGGREAVIRQEDCMGCGACYDVCQFSAIQADYLPDGACTYTVDPLACEGCGVCVHFCPERAIDFPEVVSGEWFISETRNGPMVHARLGIAAENSGKLVTLVRNEARKLANERQLDLLLVDGPPGIGCPVIASLSGVDAALVVTEPTMSGMHDLERVVRLAQHFGVPVYVCINKSDINNKMTKQICDYCHNRNLTVVGKIPFDPQVTRAQLLATAVVERNSTPAAKAIKEIWERIEPLLSEQIWSKRRIP